MNYLGLLVALLIVAVAVLLTERLIAANRVATCVESGRTNCLPIEDH